MAYTTGQTTAQMITELQTVNPALNNDAILTFLSTLATGSPVAIGTGITFSGVLVKCTTGYGVSPGTTPVYAYDASPV
jgi:hypothetical protein